MREKKQFRKNLNMTIIETILTSIGAGFSIPIINVFWSSLGMNQIDVGFVQMIFTIIIVFLDIPMGYLADRFNRKLLNIIGDIGVALTFLFYAFSKNMYMVIISEGLLGIFMAMTNGVDQSFIKYNADKIDSSGKLFKKINTKIYTYRYIATFIVMVIGGFISKYNLRLAIGISFLPYMIGGIVAFFINDYADKIQNKYKSITRDMLHNVKSILNNEKTRIYFLAYILGREITHPHIWIFTPLMVMVGIPIEVVSFGWIFSEIFKIIGAKLAEKFLHIKTSVKFALIFLVTVCWMSVLIINTNIFTIWIFVLNGLVTGIVTGSLITPLQETVAESKQATIISIASTGARILYIPLVYVINYLGNIKLQLALVGMIVFFTLPSIYTYIKLSKVEKNMP